MIHDIKSITGMKRAPAIEASGSIEENWGKPVKQVVRLV